jgi:hypothetical protein
MTPVIAECTGLWRRTLLIEADGSRDTGTTVVWLQGLSMFVDVRGPGEGFAGRLDQHNDVFEWTRLVDLQPPGLPDAGRMSWAGDILVEEGVHADYTEQWHREPGPSQPCWGLLLSAPDSTGLLMRVGERFGWAWQRGDEAGVSLGAVAGNAWQITDSTDRERMSLPLTPVLTSKQLRVDDDIAWDIKEYEGSVTL